MGAWLGLRCLDSPALNFSQSFSKQQIDRILHSPASHWHSIRNAIQGDSRVIISSNRHRRDQTPVPVRNSDDPSARARTGEGMIQSTIRMTIPPHKSNDAMKILGGWSSCAGTIRAVSAATSTGTCRKRTTLSWRKSGRSQEHLDLHHPFGRIPQPAPGPGDVPPQARDPVRHHLGFGGHRDHREGERFRQMNWRRQHLK